MKKLLIMTGVAAFALGAFAAFTNGTGFDELNTGAFVPGTYWNNPAELEASVVAYENGEALAVRPAYFTDDNVNFLAIESASASTPLKRFVETTEDAKAIGNGLYLDTLVQFTVSTETMGASEGSNAKLAIWAQTSDETPAVTNFVVQAGYVTASGVEAHNYAMTAPADFDYTAWHRLTVKAIANIDANATSEATHVIGFVVFVDETALTRANSAAIGDEGYVPTLNTVAGKFAAAVLPSMVNTGNTKTTLQAVSFSGNGKIDDVSFTDVAPQFAENDVIFTLHVGDGITGFTLNGTAYSDFSAGYVTLTLDPSDTTVTVGSVTYATGYKNAALSGPTDGNIDGLEFTVTGDAPAATISAVRDMFTITVGGDTFGYATLADAIADAAKGTIVMADNYTIPGSTFIDVTSDVVLDLAGKSLTGPENDALFAVAEGVSLTIVNSAVNDASLLVNYSEEDYVPAERYVVTNNGGDVIIGNKDGGFVVVNGNITEAVSANANEHTIYKGKFAVASNSNGAGNACDLSPESIAEGSTLLDEPVEGYWVVNAGGEVEPTTYKVTFVDYDGTEISSGDVAEGETPTAPTAPSRTGYTFTGWTPTIAAVTEAATYTATYSANTYKVTFYTNAVEYATATYTYGDASTYTAPAAPVVDGFTFGGWFTDDGTFETAFVFSADVAADTQVAYAKLTANEEPPEIEPVDPANGGTAEFADVATATAAAVAINEDKAKYIAAPEGIANTYYDNVEAKADGTTVSVVFTTAGETAAQTSADAEVDELDKVLSAAAAGATEASITDAVPGFFYSVVYGTSLTGESAFANEGTRAQADKDGNVTIPVPTAGEGAGFYKVKVSPTK